MNKIYLLLILTLTSSICFATFSIVAVDPETGEVGSAGGSCIAGSIIISDIHVGLGAIHTQSYYHPTNQNNASSYMEQGYSPEEIINLLELNDVSNNSGIRQYGVVDLEDNGRSFSFTGENCSDWKGHLNGPNYAIQGNILLGLHILQNMESNFINTTGHLSQRLMAALQGANIPGADTRCLDEGISTLSAFIRVAKPDDLNNNFYLDLNVNTVIPHFNETGEWLEPIDSLQYMFNNWLESEFPQNHGDLNQDGTIDILDIVTIVNIVLGHISPTFAHNYLGDVNGDSITNIQDIILIVNMIL